MTPVERGKGGSAADTFGLEVEYPEVAELRNAHDRYRDALKLVVAIATEPRDSMTWNRRCCEERGQAMLNAANGALDG